MAAIHDTRECHTSRHGGNQHLEDMIVTKDAILGVIHGTERFVFPIVFVSVLVRNRAPVSRVVKKASIARLRLRGQGLKGFDDIRRCGWGVFSIIQQVDNVVIRKTVAILNVLGHVKDIIVTATQFTGVVPNVVNSNHHGPTGPFKIWRNDGEGLIEVCRPRATELRDLFKAHFSQLFTCRDECFLESQISSRVGVISVGCVEQGTRQSPSGSARGVGELERPYIGNICTRLTVLAS
mmetsp:Transcript_5539/g.10788  ORF Transcript_5539/g.10788 Transcript_5539/m.10788 type:complete len:237 (-) Transcript_5539:242-952(-)